MIRNDKKRNCTKCDSKIVDGQIVIVRLSAKNKIQEYLCSEKCVKGEINENATR
jgi:hypothetical protein